MTTAIIVISRICIPNSLFKSQIILLLLLSSTYRLCSLTWYLTYAVWLVSEMHFFMLSQWMSDQTISIESLLNARHNAGCWGYNIKTRHNVVLRAYIIQYIITVVMAGQSPVRVYTHGRSLFHMLRESLLSDFKMRPKEGGSWRPCSGMRDKTMYRKGLRWKGAWIQRQGQYCCNVRLVEIGQQMIEIFTLCSPWWGLWCKPNISIVSYGGNLSFTCVWNSGYFLLNQFLSPNVGLFTSCCLLY